MGYGKENGIKITHVFKDLPVNSHYRYDVLYSDDTPFVNRPENKYSLWIQACYTYLVMLARNIELFVLGGAVIASLIAYYAIDAWLTDFKYKININENLWIFLIAAVVAITVTFITIAIQSYRIARSNPINSIRYE